MIRKAQETQQNNGFEIEMKVNEESLLISDYLVGKVQYTEKKVFESLKKLHYVKESILNCKVPVDSSGDLLGHHQKQTLI